MRVRLFTAQREIGTVDLAPGVTIPDLVREMRNHRLFVTDQPAQQLRETTLPAADAVGSVEVVPDGDASESATPRRSRKVPAA